MCTPATAFLEQRATSIIEYSLGQPDIRIGDTSSQTDRYNVLK